MNEPQCEGCGQRPEVYGSSWCAACAWELPEYVKRRLLTMRNALITLAYGRRYRVGAAYRLEAARALEKPAPEK